MRTRSRWGRLSRAATLSDPRRAPAITLPGPLPAAGMAATAGVAVSVFVGPWFALYRYTPNGWHATWWARLALLLAAINLVLMAADLFGRAQVALAALTVAAVALRVVWPPDFGFAFDGLRVPVARRPGVWVALGLALVALALTALSQRRSRSTKRHT